MRHRRLAKLRANLLGYFWLPCAHCGGQEWRNINDHFSDVPKMERGKYGYGGRGICPDCTAAGVGCRAWASAPHRKCHPGCEFVPISL